MYYSHMSDSKINKLSLNCQSISTKFDNLTSFLDDANSQKMYSGEMGTGRH